MYVNFNYVYLLFSNFIKLYFLQNINIKEQSITKYNAIV